MPSSRWPAAGTSTGWWPRVLVHLTAAVAGRGGRLRRPPRGRGLVATRRRSRGPCAGQGLAGRRLRRRRRRTRRRVGSRIVCRVEPLETSRSTSSPRSSTAAGERDASRDYRDAGAVGHTLRMARVIVVGAGVVGLCPARSGCWRPVTTSTWWPVTCRWRRRPRPRPRCGTPTAPTPSSGSPPGRAPPTPSSRRCPATRTTGVRMVSGTELHRTRQARPLVARRGAGPDPGRPAPRAPYADGWTFVAPVVEMPVYLRWLSAASRSSAAR